MHKKHKHFFILIIVIMLISIGYAYLNTTLSINGTTNVDANTWNVYWDNVQVTSGSVSASTPTIDSNLTTVSFSVHLEKPGDFYEFTVDAVNDGTIDAMIDSISSKLNGVEITTLPTYLEYSIIYADDGPLVAKQELNAGDTETYKIRVGYKTEINASDLPSTNQHLDFSFAVTYVQEDDTSIVVNHPVSFSTDSWDTIITAVQDGNTSKYHVGDTKTIKFSGSNTNYTLRIVNTSTPQVCSQANFSQTACGIVIMFDTSVASRGMNTSDTNSGGWANTSLRTYLNDTVYNLLPTELSSEIIDTSVISGHGSNQSSNFYSTDKLYLISSVELWNHASNDTAGDLTRQLDYFEQNGVEVVDVDGQMVYNNISFCQRGGTWWLRGASSTTTANFQGVTGAGKVVHPRASVSYSVYPAFRIG